MEPPVGFEPTTHCLQNSSSTAELRWLAIFTEVKQKDSILKKKYCQIILKKD